MATEPPVDDENARESMSAIQRQRASLAAADATRHHCPAQVSIHTIVTTVTTASIKPTMR
jgi:hypothetical protein